MKAVEARSVEGEIPVVCELEFCVRRVGSQGSGDGAIEAPETPRDRVGCDAMLEPLRTQIEAAEAAVRDLLVRTDQRRTLQELRARVRDALPEAGSSVRRIAVWRLVERGEIHLSDDRRLDLVDLRVD